MMPRLPCGNPTCRICRYRIYGAPPEEPEREPLRLALLALAGVVLCGLAVVLVWAGLG